MIRTLVTVFAGLLGLAFGSFLNVCVSRWPQGESVVRPGSHCRACGRTLRWWENVPVVSWLALRGRCRTCGARIGVRYAVVEAAVGGLWAWVAWTAWDAPSPVAFAVGRMFFFWLMVALAVLDAEHLWLPDAMTLWGAGVGFVWWLIQGERGGWAATGRTSPWGDAKPIALRLLSIALAAGIILFIRWVYWLVRGREGMGLGDAKLMALLAAWLGFPGALVAFAFAVMAGALAAVAQLARRREDMEAWARGKLPLGSFLSVGGIVSALWGERIVEGYLRWAGF